MAYTQDALDSGFEYRGQTYSPARTFKDGDGRAAQLVNSGENFALYLEGLDGEYKPTAFWPKEILKALIDERA